MEHENRTIKKIIKRNYLLVILGGIGGIALLMLLYYLMPYTDYNLPKAVYLTALTFLFAMWLSVWIILIQTTAALEHQTDNIETVRAERSNLSQENLRRSIQYLEKQVCNLEEYCRQVITSVRVYDTFVHDMGIDDWHSLLDEKIWSLEVNRKIKNQLIRANIWTIRQLVSLSVNSLTERTRMGEMSLNKLRDSLHSMCKYLHLELLYVHENGADYHAPKEKLLQIFDDEANLKKEEQ